MSLPLAPDPGLHRLAALRWAPPAGRRRSCGRSPHPPVSVGSQGGARPFNWIVPSPPRVRFLPGPGVPHPPSKTQREGTRRRRCALRACGPPGSARGPGRSARAQPPLRAPWSSPKMAATMKKAVSGRSRAGARAAGAGPRGAGRASLEAPPRGRRGARGRAPDPRAAPRRGPPAPGAPSTGSGGPGVSRGVGSRTSTGRDAGLSRFTRTVRAGRQGLRRPLQVRRPRPRPGVGHLPQGAPLREQSGPRVRGGPARRPAPAQGSPP